MDTENYIKEQMLYFAQNIDEYNIVENIKDLDGSICKITNKTRNTIEVEIKATSENGITSKRWYQMTGNDRFEKRFSKININ